MIKYHNYIIKILTWIVKNNLNQPVNIQQLEYIF